MLRHFTGSLIFTVVALAMAAAYGFFNQGGIGPALAALWICIVLGVLEVSLSFDNAVVNARTLKTMDAVWQQRFLTWGILIAVFGMRIVFPLIIVAVAGSMSPLAALTMALQDPEQYERVLTGAHHGIMGFGGAFLMLVGLKFFFDADKEHHWIGFIERPLTKFADLEAIEIILVLAIAYLVSIALPGDEGQGFFTAALFGVFAFFAVEWLGNILEAPEAAEEDTTPAGNGATATATVARAGLGAFLYLEVLDASFSFDGVIGAFALSNNLVIIALGLGIGAMFVRSLTVALVRQGTLSQFLYLEHGAFWAILALAGIMFASVHVEIPEIVTGLIGAALIGLSLWSSVRHNRAAAHA
jgi:uncharacterized protein